jgi:hypothetical protein
LKQEFFAGCKDQKIQSVFKEVLFGAVLSEKRNFYVLKKLIFV